MQILHGYSLDEKHWETRGANGECNTAVRDGRVYFIKRLLKPRYPSDKITGKAREVKIAQCEQWLKKRREIMKRLPGTGSGLLVKPIEYFREGCCYYEVANYVEQEPISYDQIWRQPLETKKRILLTVAMTLADVHKAGIIYGDLDPGNILITRSAGGNLIVKLIDFTDAFFADDIPPSIMSKEFWWSPELALYSMASEERPNPYLKDISNKMDVFSLGIVFHQLLSKGGKGPDCSIYPWMELQDRSKLKLNPGIEPEFRKIIEAMLECNPDDRPTMAEVHEMLMTVHIEQESLLMPGSGRNGGAAVTAVNICERNPKKAWIIFENGKTELLPIGFAREQHFIK